MYFSIAIFCRNITNLEKTDLWVEREEGNAEMIPFHKPFSFSTQLVSCGL
jgi:hypothetical protein